MKSNILNNETLKNVIKISFNQRLPSKNHDQNNNNSINNKTKTTIII